MRLDLVDRVFSDLRECRVTNWEALQLLAEIRAGRNPYGDVEQAFAA